MEYLSHFVRQYSMFHFFIGQSPPFKTEHCLTQCYQAPQKYLKFVNLFMGR